ncbi:MAG: proliferating cell nuclear antigen (pcna) [Candidatus Aenigmatarchaeota archaeon]
MFKATLSDISLLRNSISTISEIIGEGLFKVDDSGISLKAADRSMVAVVDFNLKSDVFDEYECDEETSIGVNIENLLEIMKRGSGSDSLTLELSEGENQLKIVVKGNSTRSFSLPLLDISEGETPETEQLDFDADLSIKSEILKQGINDADIVGDSVILKANSSEFIMTTDSDNSSVEVTLDKNSEGLKDLEAEEEVRSRYPLEYLKKMIKASKISETVSLKMGSDFPLKMEFSQPEKVSMGFVLAPRVED